MKTITNYKELEQLHKDINGHILKCPFSTVMRVEHDGCFISDESMALQPKEALRLGKFLVEFYGSLSEKE